MTTSGSDWRALVTITLGFLFAPVVAFLIPLFLPLENVTARLAVGAGVFVFLIIALAWTAHRYFRQPSPNAGFWKTSLTTLGTAFAAVTATAHTSVWEKAKEWLTGTAGHPAAEQAARPENLWYFTFLCVTVAVVALIYSRRVRPTITSAAPGSTPAGGPAADPAQVRQWVHNYCRALKGALDRDDDAVNWADTDLVPLEAEVAADRTRGLRARVVPNLLAAIRRDRQSSVFIVIGDPGGGKSVSLKHLVRGLIDEVESARVPVYVNLRTFPAGTEVTPKTLAAFVRQSVRDQTERAGEPFLQACYDRYLEDGNLFFVFDSFDELPQVLDAPDHSDTHRLVCEAFDRLFTADLHRCRVMLASRPFRAPSGIQGTRLSIRPLTEPQVRQLVAGRLTHYGVDPDDLVRRVFADRPEFAPLLRNPFYAELLADYARRVGGTLPKSAFDLFDQFVTSRLDGDQARVQEKYDVSVADLRAAARLLGHEMFAADRGLEVDTAWAVDRLNGRWPGQGAALAGGLSYSRFARLGSHERGKFSFVHRRFAEFFAVEVLRDEGDVPELNQIPTDGRWRDGLVMFCGIAAPSVQAEVAGYCWDRVRAGEADLRTGRLSTTEAKEAVHCLRFLVDAFRSAPDALAGFRPDLGILVRDLAESKDSLVAKFAAEAIPLLDPADRGPAIVRAMASPFDWVQESTVTACRAIRDLYADTLAAIRVHYARKPFHVKWLARREALFTLSLSEAFRPLKRAYLGDLFEGVARLMLLVAVLVYVGLVHHGVTVLAILTVLAIVIVFMFILRAAEEWIDIRARRVKVSPMSTLTTQLFSDPLRLGAFSLAHALLFAVMAVRFFVSDPAPTTVSDLLLPKLEQPLLRTAGLMPVLLVCAMFNWEMIPRLLARCRRWRSWFTGLRLPAWSVVGRYALIYLSALAFIAAVIGVLALIVNLGIFLYFAATVGALIAVTILILARKRVWDTYRDHRVLGRGVPEVAEPGLLFATLRELRQDRGRRAYIQTLLARRVKLPPEAAIPDPDPEVAMLLEKSRGLNEDWGKLREFWLNLSR